MGRLNDISLSFVPVHARPSFHILYISNVGFVQRFKQIFPFLRRHGFIVGLSWHDLRATFGTRLGEAGYDAFTIAQLMGHSDIRMTARYVRGTERNKRAAVEAVLLDFQVTRHNGVTKQEQPPKLVAVSS